MLAGGFGTRLRAVVSDVPKPLAPVGGRPFLHWLLDGLARQGVSRVVLATGYRADAIRAAVRPDHAGMDIVQIADPAPLGTGGAIWQALAACRAERVFVLNGDTWLGLPLAAMAAHPGATDLLMAVRPVADRGRYGSVRLAGDRVLGIAEKATGGPGLVNAGVYLLSRDLPARRPMPAAFSLETEILARPRELDIRAHLTEAPFLDIGTPDDFARAQALIPSWAEAA